jgi:chemotaxis protein methyltransferase CheR
MSDDLRALGDAVHRASGIVVRDEQLGSLRAALARADPRATARDVLRGDPERLDRLVEQVAINETFFLRHLDELAEIDWPAAAARASVAGRSLRVWSVACSTGEEAYTLAMLAVEALDPGAPPIAVLGTDLSAPALARARRGTYGTRSMRLVNRVWRDRWFVAEGDALRVGDELSGLVRFARHNMVADAFPPQDEAPFDVVVCRNVLIYFDAATVALVTAALRRALVPNGQLLLGTVDRLGSPPPVAVAPPPAAVPTRRSAELAAHVRRRPAPRAPREPRRPAPTHVATRRLHEGSTVSESAAEAGHAAFEAGSLALSQGDAAAAAGALRRALYLDPRRAVVALQLGRAHEALGDAQAARRAYLRALRLVDEAPDPGALLYDRIGAGDVAAACRARLAALPATGRRRASGLIEP